MFALRAVSRVLKKMIMSLHSIKITLAYQVAISTAHHLSMRHPGTSHWPRIRSPKRDDVFIRWLYCCSPLGRATRMELRCWSELQPQPPHCVSAAVNAALPSRRLFLPALNRPINRPIWSDIGRRGLPRWEPCSGTTRLPHAAASVTDPVAASVAVRGPARMKKRRSRRRLPMRSRRLQLPYTTVASCVTLGSDKTAT